MAKRPKWEYQHLTLLKSGSVLTPLDPSGSASRNEPWTAMADVVDDQVADGWEYVAKFEVPWEGRVVLVFRRERAEPQRRTRRSAT